MNLHNLNCELNNDMESQIFVNDEEFFEMFFSGRQSELIRACEYGNHNFRDNFVQFNGYANLDSFDNVSNEVDIQEIANNILENERHFDIDLIEDED